MRKVRYFALLCVFAFAAGSAEARNFSLKRSFVNGLNGVKRLLITDAGKSSLIKQVIAGGGVMLVLCTGSILSSCSTKRFSSDVKHHQVIKSEFVAADLLDEYVYFESDSGEKLSGYVEKAFDNNKILVQVYTQKGAGEIFSEEDSNILEEDYMNLLEIDASQVKATIDESRFLEIGLGVLIAGTDEDPDALRSGIIVVPFTDGSLEVLVHSMYAYNAEVDAYIIETVDEQYFEIIPRSEVIETSED